MNLKNLKSFKGNKRGAPWILQPTDKNNKTFADIPKLKPDEVNIVTMIKAESYRDEKGKRNHPKRVVLCKVSDLPDDGQDFFIFQKIKDLQTKLDSASETVRTGAETTVKDMLNAYLLSPKVLREKNHFGKVKHLSFFKDEIGHIVLMDIKPKDIRKAKDKLLLPNPNAKRTDCLAGKTVNNYIRSLRTAFDWATKNYDNFEFNPVYYVESEVQETFEHRALTDAERERLFKVIARRTNTDKSINKFGHRVSKELHDFVTWGIWVGSRKGETLALHWDNIDFKKQEVTFTHAIRRYECKAGEMKDGEAVFDYNINVRTKGLKASVKQRSTSFEELPQIREILLRRWSQRSGDRIFSQDCRTAWESCLKEAEIENFRYHDLRKTCGSYLYQNDATLEDIAYYLGHKGTNTTEQTYVRKDNEVSKKLGKLLQERMG